MMTVKEVKDWIEACGLKDDDQLWIGEGGLTLEAEGPELEELYIEIGGRDEDYDSQGNYVPWPPDDHPGIVGGRMKRIGKEKL